MNVAVLVALCDVPKGTGVILGLAPPSLIVAVRRRLISVIGVLDARDDHRAA